MNAVSKLFRLGFKALVLYTVALVALVLLAVFAVQGINITVRENRSRNVSVKTPACEYTQQDGTADKTVPIPADQINKCIEKALPPPPPPPPPPPGLTADQAREIAREEAEKANPKVLL